MHRLPASGHLQERAWSVPRLPCGKTEIRIKAGCARKASRMLLVRNNQNPSLLRYPQATMFSVDARLHSLATKLPTI